MSTTTCPACRAAITVPERTRDGTVECGACGHAFPRDAAVEAPPEPPPPTFDRQFPVTPYVSLRRGSPTGLVLAVLNGLIATLFVTIGFAVLRSQLWVIVFFPILQGLVVGLCPGLAARLGRVRYPGVVGLAGSVCGLLSYVGVQYVFYLVVSSDPEVPRFGFWEFMDLRAAQGVQLGRGGNRGLGYAGSVLYWLFEAGLTATAAWCVAASLVKSPFCAGCSRWKRRRELGTYLTDPTVALPAVAAGSPAGLAAPGVGTAKVAVTVFTCPNCQDQGPVDVEAVGTRKVGKKFETSRVFVTYPGEALAAFEDFDRACRANG